MLHIDCWLEEHNTDFIYTVCMKPFMFSLGDLSVKAAEKNVFWQQLQIKAKEKQVIAIVSVQSNMQMLVTEEMLQSD